MDSDKNSLGCQAASKRGQLQNGLHTGNLSISLDLTSWPEGGSGYLTAYTDFIAPRLNTTLLLAALDYRGRKGRGQFLDVSQYEASTHWLGPSPLDYFANGRIAQRMGNRHAHVAPHGAYPCTGTSAARTRRTAPLASEIDCSPKCPKSSLEDSA